jgi:GntR family transcriptional regulator
MASGHENAVRAHADRGAECQPHNHSGLLDRRHGSGTYVAPVRFLQPLDSVYSFTDQFRKRGILLENEIRVCEIMAASDDLAHKLGIQAGDPLVYLQRLRSVHGVPLMINFSYTPLKLVPNLMHERDYLSLYALLTEKYKLTVYRAEDYLESISASGEIAALLHIKRHAPLMLVERVAYTRTASQDDVPLQVARNYIRGDACRFQTELTSLIYRLPVESVVG